MNDWDYTVKIIIIGDSGVGKSCLLYRFADDSFDESHINTIGVDFRIRTIKCDDQSVRLQTWDTAGQDRFLAITTSYYRGSDGIFLVYDVTNEESFQNIKKWMVEVNKYAREAAEIILIGNKCDLEHKRAVSYLQGKKLAEELGVGFLETSARKSTNVEQAFEGMAKNILTNLKNRSLPKDSRLSGSNNVIDSISVGGGGKKPDCGCSLV